jgi:large conductance mechanosensitive channel
MPLIGVATGGLDFSGLSVVVGKATIAYGKFIQSTFVFLVVAFSLFLVVKGLNTMKKKEDAKPAEPSQEIKLLAEIRDLLKRS